MSSTPSISILLSPLSTFPTSTREVEHYIAVIAGLEKAFEAATEDKYAFLDVASGSLRGLLDGGLRSAPLHGAVSIAA